MQTTPWEHLSWEERIAEQEAHLANQSRWKSYEQTMGAQWTAAKRADEKETLAWLIEQRDAAMSRTQSTLIQ